VWLLNSSSWVAFSKLTSLLSLLKAHTLDAISIVYNKEIFPRL
jgi:hypothetical protein